MPSAAAKKKADRKKALEKERMAKKLGKVEGKEEPEEAVEEGKVCPVGKITEDVKELNARSTAGVLSSPALGADIHIHNFTMSFHGNVRFIHNQIFFSFYRFYAKIPTLS
jgi:ATP-binding cassette, subfamily F, member 2